MIFLPGYSGQAGVWQKGRRRSMTERRSWVWQRGGDEVWQRRKDWRIARDRADREKVRLIFNPSGSPFKRGEGNKEDPLTFRLVLNEGWYSQTLPDLWLRKCCQGATLSRYGHLVCNAHFALLPLAHELTNSRLSLKISPLEIFSAFSPKTLGRGKYGKKALGREYKATLFDLDPRVKPEDDIKKKDRGWQREGAKDDRKE